MSHSQTFEAVYDSVIAPSNTVVQELTGINDSLLRIIEQQAKCDIHLRGTTFVLAGTSAAVQHTKLALEELIVLAERGTELDRHLIVQTFRMLRATRDSKPSHVLGQVALSHRGRQIKARTLGQRHYLDAIAKNTVTFGFGPAGTGKTYLAMAMAVAALRAKEVTRIILTRPAVEAGESLGFLPGTLSEKIDPYLRPLFDALHDMMDAQQLAEYMEKGIIEVAPLAYMRGRTLNEAFVVLDEAQNTTKEQMKMFLTRIGFGTKVVITGDRTQVDLPGRQQSSLHSIQQTLEGVEDLQFCELTAEDVIRHKIVQDIVNAYAQAEAKYGA